MLLAGSTRYLHHRVQSGDSPEGKTPPPWGVLCSQRGVDQLWAERVPGGLRECVTRQAGGLCRCCVQAHLEDEAEVLGGVVRCCAVLWRCCAVLWRCCGGVGGGCGCGCCVELCSGVWRVCSGMWGRVEVV